jgi:hypothetical protein
MALLGGAASMACWPLETIGQVIVRLAENHVERLQGLAKESVALKPALIAAGSSDAAVAAKKIRRAFQSFQVPLLMPSIWVW